MKVKELMSRSVQSCMPQTSLETAAVMMWNNDCGCLPIVDEQAQPQGIITDRDIAIGAALQHRALWEITVSDITQGHALFSCQADDDVHTAMEIMQTRGIRRLPVVDAKGKLEGIISLGDILANIQTKKNADLPLQDTLGMLQAVTGHHSGKRLQVA